MPRPRKKVNNYCSVCKDYYEDYIIHISKQEHKISLKEAKFEKDIKEITERVGREIN